MLVATFSGNCGKRCGQAREFEFLEKLKRLKKGSKKEERFWKKTVSSRVGQLSLYVDDSEGVSILRCR